MSKKLTDAVLLESFLKVLGVKNGARLLGWCALVGMMAPADADRAWVLAHGPMAQAQRYRNVHDLGLVAAWLDERGYELVGSSAEQAWGVVETLARLAT